MYLFHITVMRIMEGNVHNRHENNVTKQKKKKKA